MSEECSWRTPHGFCLKNDCECGDRPLAPWDEVRRYERKRRKMDEELITIPKKEYDELKQNSDFFKAAQRVGFDKSEIRDDALDIMYEWGYFQD